MAARLRVHKVPEMIRRRLDDDDYHTVSFGSSLNSHSSHNIINHKSDWKRQQSN